MLNVVFRIIVLIQFDQCRSTLVERSTKEQPTSGHVILFLVTPWFHSRGALLHGVY